jgi:hypothetical protein
MKNQLCQRVSHAFIFGTGRRADRCCGAHLLAFNPRQKNEPPGSSHPGGSGMLYANQKFSRYSLAPSQGGAGAPDLEGRQKLLKHAGKTRADLTEGGYPNADPQSFAGSTFSQSVAAKMELQKRQAKK